MRKIVIRILMGLNILIVVCFLLLSGAFFIFSLSDAPSFLGYSALLKSGPEETLVVYHANRSIAAGDTLVLRPTGGEVRLQRIDRIDSGTAYFAGSDGQEAAIELDSSDCLGIVAFQSPFWGRALSVLLRPGNVILCYIAIGGFFLLVLLILLLVYYLGGKNDAPVLESDEDLMLLKALLTPVPEEEPDLFSSPHSRSSPFLQTPASSISPAPSPQPEEESPDDVKIYIPHKQVPAELPFIPGEAVPEAEIVIHTHYDEAYDIYDVIAPSIDDIPVSYTHLTHRNGFRGQGQQGT